MKWPISLPHTHTLGFYKSIPTNTSCVQKLTSKSLFILRTRRIFWCIICYFSSILNISYLESDSELLLINCIDMLIKTITIYRLSRKKLYPTDKILLASYRLSCASHSGATALREESSSAKETARECLYVKQKLKATTTSAVSFLLEQSVQAKLEETIRHLWWRLACASSTDTLKHVLYSFTAVADDTTQAYRSCIVSSDLVCIST